MSIQVSENKLYKRCNLQEGSDIFRGYIDNCILSTDLLSRLAKDLGFSYDLYLTLDTIDKNASDTLIKSMSTHSRHTDIVLLADKENSEIIDYTLESERLPVLNSDFIKRVTSLAETSDSISISDIYYHKDDKISSIILKKNDPIKVEVSFEGKDSTIYEYQIGVLIVNDEVNNTYSRLVLYVEGQPLYLPASYYNTTTSRYRRSTSNSLEALEVLLLKVIDDLREDELLYKIQELHYRYRANKNILASYEEYNTVLSVMRKIPSIIEDNSFLESLLSKYEDFEKKYTKLEDQRSSYVWRCTALSDITIGALVSITSKILSDLNAPSIEYFRVRELLGNYVSTSRIAEEIAKEDIR